MNTPTARTLASGLGLASGVGLVLHALHDGHQAATDLPPVLLWFRDSLIGTPAAIAAVLLGSFAASRLARLLAAPDHGPLPRLAWALVAGFAYALAPVPGNWLQVSDSEHRQGPTFVTHALVDGASVLVTAVLLLVAFAWVVGAPGEERWPVRAAFVAAPTRTAASLSGAGILVVLVLVAAGTVPAGRAAAAAFAGCGRTIDADVVALDQFFFYNRLGVSTPGTPTSPGGMIYALRGDVVNRATGKSEVEGGVLAPGAVVLRGGKRPRPLVLRMNVGDCLRISFQNLLAPTAGPEQPLDRNVGIHVNGLLLVDSIASDGSAVGANASSLVAPGGQTTYTLYSEHENTYLMENLGVTVGNEGNGGTTALGLFGAVNVEPRGSVWYRSQVAREDMDLASTGTTAGGQPILDYTARYPLGFHDGALAGRPILNMLDGTKLVHSDLNAIIAGPSGNGYRLPTSDYPASYWDNQIYNMNEQRGAEPFREFTVIFHDEINAVQAFPSWFSQAGPYRRTLAGVKDGFAINYGSGGIGNEIIANRLGVGPAWNCTECKYEEFFLTSWAVGDPGMVVDNPANQTLAGGGPGAGALATKALYPDDPSNVHHSYINDRVKFRNLHAGSKEHHVFHLHTHQWTFTPNTKSSVYLDSQLIGPGAGNTYEIAFGGSGNRNKVVGDAIFHCHFYPHFAQGMWEFWRSHDVFERGTVLDAAGRPAAGSRALPDGEITAGTPIPGVIPLPGRPMAPMPAGDSTVVRYDANGDGTADSSQLDVNGNGIADFTEGFPAPAGGRNPGFPYFIPGVAGHRPPTPALDIADTNGDGQVEDGGLPRHVIVGGQATEVHTPLDFDKTLEKAKIVYVPEKGTPAEQAAMSFHASHWHPTYLANAAGTRVDDATPLVAPGGNRIRGFETNGLPPVAGAPFAEPCRRDRDAAGNIGTAPIGNARSYKAAVVQTDAILNKAGWHFPQQRFEVLWGDVAATLAHRRAPEPFVMRLDSLDCVNFWHTNLVPNTYALDDYQVRTPTDVIGQHIHLVKFDVTSADGSGNGFNYEDGTFSPQEVTERVAAVRAQTGTCSGDAFRDAGEARGTAACPLAELHPYFGGVLGAGKSPASPAWGARTTVQRWYADPILNDSWDQGHGAVFTHDHFGPSSHQQVGLYSTVLVEPANSVWRDSETGTCIAPRANTSSLCKGARRDDGGPTSWRADVITPNAIENSYREFYLEFADFQHAYQAGGGRLHTDCNVPLPPRASCGVGNAGVQIPSYADFPNAINPSFRQEPPAGREADLYFHPGTCANGTLRPCPEAITADDPGTFVVNQRNEPIGLRVFDPATGTQTAGPAGDLAEAFESRTDRAVGALNTQPTVYPPLTSGLNPGDPWTPMLRTYMGDRVRIRAQVGATEEQHTFSAHGLKWRQEEFYGDSGWRDSQASGISEYFNLDSPVQAPLPGDGASVDYLYEMGSSTEDLWNGIWGLLRAYRGQRSDLLELPNNTFPKAGLKVKNLAQFDEVCPLQTNGAPTRVTRFAVTAVRAADVLGPNGLVYNDRTTFVIDQDGAVQGAGPLVDPTAILYVLTDDLVLDANGRPAGLQPGTPIEPLILRANAGDCIKLTLTNKLPVTMTDQPGFNALPPIVHKDENVIDPATGVPGIVSFNNNDLRPSSQVGLHPQLLTYAQSKADGFVEGANQNTLVAPDATRTYTWYAGDVSWPVDRKGGVSLVARPVEFGAIGLMPADAIKGSEKGLVGALVIEPFAATVTLDPGTRVSATVDYPASGAPQVPAGSFREFVTVLQTDANLRYGGGCAPTTENLGCAIPGIGAEGLIGPAEDVEDGGQKAINYAADPLWFRPSIAAGPPFFAVGVAPNMPFDLPFLNRNPNAHRLFSNDIVAGADPRTVFTTAPGREVRIRLVEPGGHARGMVFAVDGHAWAREPYTSNSDRITASNDVSQWIGAQDGIGPSSHFDVVLPRAGGPFGVLGDYLFRDNASFGSFAGVWGVLRVR